MDQSVKIVVLWDFISEKRMTWRNVFYVLLGILQKKTRVGLENVYRAKKAIIQIEPRTSLALNVLKDLFRPKEGLSVSKRAAITNVLPMA